MKISHKKTSLFIYFALLMKEGDKAREDYLKFLSSGSSKYPVELLEIAGVNMRESAPIQTLIDRFSELVNEFEDEFLTC